MKKRKKYRPRRVLLDNMQHVLTGFKPLEQIRSTTLRLKPGYHGALELLRRGKATREDLITIGDAINVAEAMIEVTQIGVEHLSSIRAAEAALQAIGKRDHYIAKGPELIALNLFAEIHDEQFKVVTVAEAEAAVDLIEKRIRK